MEYLSTRKFAQSPCGTEKSYSNSRVQSLTKGSDSTSTSDSVSDQRHSIKGLLNSLLDFLPERQSEQFKQVSTLVLTKNNVEAVDCSLRNMESSNYDSISNDSKHLAKKNTPCPILESVPSKSNTPPDDP